MHSQKNPNYKNDIETALDEADCLARNDFKRLTHDEVFGKLQKESKKDE